MILCIFLNSRIPAKVHFIRLVFNVSFVHIEVKLCHDVPTISRFKRIIALICSKIHSHSENRDMVCMESLVFFKRSVKPLPYIDRMCGPWSLCVPVKEVL